MIILGVLIVPAFLACLTIDGAALPPTDCDVGRIELVVVLLLLLIGCDVVFGLTGEVFFLVSKFVFFGGGFDVEEREGGGSESSSLE